MSEEQAQHGYFGSINTNSGGSRQEGLVERTVRTDASEDQREDLRTGSFLHPVDNQFQLSQDYLGECLEECLREIRLTTNVTLALLVSGVLIILLGIVLAFTSGLAPGVLTVCSGVVSEIIGGIVIGLNMRSNARLDEIARELSSFGRIAVAKEYVDQISDPERRDTQLERLIGQLLQPDSESDNT